MKLSFWSCHRVKSLGMPYQSSSIHNSIHTVVSNSAKFYPDVVFRKYTISTLFRLDLEVATGMDISDKPLSLRACLFKMKSEKSRCCLYTFRMKRTCSQLTFVYSRQGRFITGSCPTQFARLSKSPSSDFIWRGTKDFSYLIGANFTDSGCVPFGEAKNGF